MAVIINGSTGVTTPGISNSEGYTGDGLTIAAGAPSGAVAVDSSGNVGIGTSSPSSAGNNPCAVVYGGSNQARFCLKNSATGNTSDDGLQIGVDASAEAFIDNRENTPLRFTTNATERMRIDSSGNLLVGATSYSYTGNGVYLGGINTEATNVGRISVGGNNGSTSTGYSLYSTSASAFRFYVSYAGQIYATSTTISGISDQRFKENVRDLDVGLNAIMGLKPRLFDWKEGKGKDIKNDRGFIAQEFEQVFPDMIDEWKDPAPEGEEPYKSVRQDLIPVLVKAIQEQQAIINAQQAALESLTARVVALEGAQIV